MFATVLRLAGGLVLLSKASSLTAGVRETSARVGDPQVSAIASALMLRGDGVAELGRISRSETLSWDDLRSSPSSSSSERRFACTSDSGVLLPPLDCQQRGRSRKGRRVLHK